MTTIQCRICRESKRLEDFYARADSPVGHRSECKVCVKNRSLQYRRTHADVVQAKERARGRLPHRRALAARKAKEWNERNPGAVSAWKRVMRAIRQGHLARNACATCGATERLHMHHEDYERPYDVQCLCVSCHRKLHAKARPAGCRFA